MDWWSDLQEIVDALSVRLGRPVLVDDVDLRPLAYSIQFGDLDSVRTESILGRTAPDAARSSLFGHGIRSAREPVRTPAHPDIGMEARICIPILRGGRRLGFLWLIEDAAIDDDELSLARAAASEAANVLQSEADTQLDRRRREQELLTALLSPDTRTSEAAAAVLETDHYVPPRPLLVIVGSGGAVPDALDRFRARTPVKHALCGEIAGRATCIVGAQATMRGPQLAEALRSVMPEGVAAHAGEGDAVPELREARTSHRRALAALRVAVELGQVRRDADIDEVAVPRHGHQLTPGRQPGEDIALERGRAVERDPLQDRRLQHIDPGIDGS